MGLVVARFEPPLDDGLALAAAQFKCVVRHHDGIPDAGETAVQEFLTSGAFATDAEEGHSTTDLAIDDESSPASLLGYVTLTMTQIKLSNGERRRAGIDGGRGSFGAVRIAMIGVAGHAQGRGIGYALMNATKVHAARLSREISVRFIVADALDTQLDWYERQGFQLAASESERDRLAQLRERTGVASTSVWYDLGPDPRILLS